jgi:hypothetical protein
MNTTRPALSLGAIAVVARGGKLRLFLGGSRLGCDGAATTASTLGPLQINASRLRLACFTFTFCVFQHRGSKGFERTRCLATVQVTIIIHVPSTACLQLVRAARTSLPYNRLHCRLVVPLTHQGTLVEALLTWRNVQCRVLRVQRQ